MGSEPREATVTILWLTVLGNSPNGLSIRHKHFGRHLRKRGYKVHLVVPDSSRDSAELESYLKSGIIDGFSVFRGFNASGLKGLLSRLTVHPALKNYFRRSAQREITATLESFVRRHEPATVLISERTHLFAVSALREQTRVAIDWCDSLSLNYCRELKRALKAVDLRSALRSLYELITTALDESYYPKFANVNLVICEPDREVYKLLNKQTEFAVLPNGIDQFTSPLTQRVSDRIIFTGVMNFPPNYHSALWFIDHVLPQVRLRRPGVQFVVAGRDPIEALRSRSNEFITVTGQVPDLGWEISRAQLYVAPMISGGGFKNKVVEAFGAGTPVIGTRMAAEFLPDTLKHDVVITDNASEMADAIVAGLANPGSLLARVNHAQDVLRRQYSWAQCTDSLICHVSPAATRPQPAAARAAS